MADPTKLEDSWNLVLAILKDSAWIASAILKADSIGAGVLKTCSVKAGFSKLHIVKNANHEKNWTIPNCQKAKGASLSRDKMSFFCPFSYHFEERVPNC